MRPKAGDCCLYKSRGHTERHIDTVEVERDRGRPCRDTRWSWGQCRPKPRSGEECWQLPEARVEAWDG